MGVYVSDEKGKLKKYGGITKMPKTIVTGLPLGLIIPAAIVSDDTNLQLLDGSCITQSGTYAEFCAWLKARISANTSNVPTCTITEYASEMAVYGQCGKFVINDSSSDLSSNGYTVYANSIKLPTITEFIASNNGGDTIGLAELDMFKKHSHVQKTTNANYAGDWTYYYEGGTGGTSGWQHNGSANYVHNASNYVTTNETGGEETKPKNIRYPYYIVVATGLKLAVVANMDGVTNDIKNINNTLNRTEQVDVVYDKDVSNKNWGGYTSGLRPVNGTFNVDLSKYKKLRITCLLDTNYFTFFADIDNKSVYSGGGVFPRPDGVQMYVCGVQVTASTFKVHKIGYTSGSAFTDRDNNDSYRVIKIEGVY